MENRRQMSNDSEETHNGTTVMKFILLGFPGSHNLKKFIFILFLPMYSTLTVLGNTAIIMLVYKNQRLRSPMYFFLCNLSFLEIWFTTASVPKTLAVLLGRSKTISFLSCIVQMYFLFGLGFIEFTLLAVMAYDRYLAICYPLHYTTIMNLQLSSKLAAICWLSGFVVISVPAVLIARLNFCGSNVINHFYCNIDSWVVLSCSSTFAVQAAMFVIAGFSIVGSCVITLLSYTYIISTILSIPSTKVKRKPFSTCSSHLAVVIIWYGSTIFVFLKPSKKASVEMSKVVNALNMIVSPMLNPFIYTLRNKEVKEAFRQLFHQK